MRRLTVPVVAGLAFAIPMFLSSPASAKSIADCGNINVEANAKCELVAKADCKVKCTPLSFQAQCAAQGYLSCDGQCTGTLPSCEAECQGSCEGSCKGGTIDCSANCTGTCEADCSGKCASAADKTQCQASCKATCGGECEASCKGTPATCQGSCQGSCKGSCSGRANIQCQAECQGKLQASCEVNMKGGCEGDCDVDGALFCDGQYVDHGGHLKSCLDALKSQLNIQVSGSASGQCSGNSCTAEAEGSASCGGHIAPKPETSKAWAIGVGALAILGGIFAQRRKFAKKA